MKQSAIERKWNLIRVVDGVATLQMDQLEKPLGWRKPARAFVGDIFHESLPDSDIDKIFAVMALRRDHTFQILTKRPERMAAYCNDPETPERIARIILVMNWGQTGEQELACLGERETEAQAEFVEWPICNLYLGVSVHDQASADEFVPLLLATPAAKRFVSYEPALGPVDWTNINDKNGGSIESLIGFAWDSCTDIAQIDQIIFGGEIGPNARPAHPDWARNTQRQCAAAGTAFYFNGWGDWGGEAFAFKDCWKGSVVVDFDGNYRAAEDALPSPNSAMMIRVGKKRAGRLLDGVEYSEVPR